MITQPWIKQPVSLLGLSAMLVLWSLNLSAQEPGLYHPRGMSMWDTWYLQRGAETHVFHLQLQRNNVLPASDNNNIGHAVSTDLIHWKELPVALRGGGSQGRSYDDGHLFTGCAIEHNNTVYLFYCGNHQTAERNRQSMCLATSPSQDGVNFPLLRSFY